MLYLLIHTCSVGLVLSYAYNDYNNPNVINSGSPPKREGSCGCMQGVAGPPGVPGVPGMHGHRGEDGRKGEKGDFGSPGNDGFRGDRGPMGPNGEQGGRGKKGYSGPPGAKAERGPQGEPGMPGPIGPPGGGDGTSRSKRVAFSVVRSTKLGPVMQDTPVTFDRIVTNVGGGFDEYSSHFICRWNGTYVFMTHLLSQNQQDVYAWIMENSKHRVPLHGDGRAGYGTASQSIILHLVYDDHVWLQLSKDSALLNDYSTFSGYMLFDE